MNTRTTAAPTPYDTFDLDIPGENTATVKIHITEEDIAEMEYYLNECPMANMSTNNAVACALRRSLRRDLSVSVAFRRGLPTAKIGDWESNLDRKICSWLAKILMGSAVGPFSFTMEIPRPFLPSKRRRLDLLPPSLRRSENEPIALGA